MLYLYTDVLLPISDYHRQPWTLYYPEAQEKHDQKPQMEQIFFLSHITVWRAWLWQVNETKQSSSLHDAFALLLFTRVSPAPAGTNLVSAGHIIAGRGDRPEEESHISPRARWYLGRLWFVLYRQNVFMERQQTQAKPQWSYWCYGERCSGLFPCQWSVFSSSLCIIGGNSRTKRHSSSIIESFCISHANS